MSKKVQRLLAVMTFVTTTLAAIHMLTFVWLTAMVYQDDIRGYVPAGITSGFVLAVASIVMLFYLPTAARRCGDRSTSYLLLGCLGVPASVIGSAIYAGVLTDLLGRSWRTDVAINFVGALICLGISFALHKAYIGKKAANNAIEAYR